MYNFADGANIVFKNCNFMLCDGSNALRVDNLQDAKNVLITFEDCVWNFQSTTAYGKDWDALIIFQDSAHLDAPHFADWKLVVKNCKFGEDSITPETFKNYADFVITNEESKNGKALLYMYTAAKSGDTWWKPTENSNRKRSKHESRFVCSSSTHPRTRCWSYGFRPKYAYADPR